jgi:3D (Asp-Asp-Asp) domain-containing protein
VRAGDAAVSRPTKLRQTAIRCGDCFVAADKKYAFGTEVIVPGYNDGLSVQVLDRGRVIKDDRLDLFFASHKKAARWGVKYIDVKIQTER